MEFYFYKILGKGYLKTLFFIPNVYIILGISTFVHAEVVVPDSGTITKQLGQESFKSHVKDDQKYFDVDITQQNYSRDQTPIWVGKVQIEGNHQIKTELLYDLVHHLENKNNVLADLQLATDEITHFYKKQGYFLAKAYLPKQKLENGVLIIRVLEGQLGKVILNNQSSIQDEIIYRYTNRIPVNQALQQHQANKTLLLISDVPSVGQIQANLQAGEQIGQTDLVLDILGQKAISGRVGVDNGGSSYTGQYRFSGYLESNGFIGYGEKISAQILSSDQNLVLGNINAQFPITGNGLSLGGGYSRTEYELGEQFELLEVKGTSENYNLHFIYPLIRSQKTNLNLKLSFEERKLFDEIAATDTETLKKIGASRITFNFSRLDEWGIGNVKGGINQLQFITTFGHLNIKSPSALNIDRLSAKSQGNFHKYEWKLSRQQRLGASSWFTGELYGQLSSKNLDSAEKFSFYQMRAYPAAEGLGDQGWGASTNFYYQLSPFVNTFLFQDIGRIQHNKKVYLNEKNNRSLASTGIGLGGGYKYWDYNLTLAWRNTSTAKSDTDKNPRFAFQVGWRF
ncbi:ShlB/FhaC/HecB family hemolysin secretion/activation protein [Acinetobacter beijerinckii]|uniref:ShlB/FhaC/HecB family hemolysin secretion/activation protein n=1 Tax=Acinetobacter beijerinckii TaxID=262668 RepID=UPI00240769C8|nr:POTRA domain-containing protein [Acinetobacter beijerinckii]